MIASIVGSPGWAVVAAVLVVLAYTMTAWVIFHEPGAKTPGPGHPAYEGDEDEDEG